MCSTYDYPRLCLNIECSGGTYVRSLGRDLAEALGTGAVMSALERTAIGGFHIEDAIDGNQLKRHNLNVHLIPPLRAVENLPLIKLNEIQLSRIARGQFIDCPQPISASQRAGDFAAVDDRGNLAAILRLRPDGQLGAALNFSSQS